MLLRICVGWHFLYQGIWKFTNPNFSSSGFLSQAKGPLADRYLALIPDFYGHDRLDGDQVAARWQETHQQFVGQYRLDEAQQAEAQRRLANRTEQMRDYLAENKAEIDTYFHELERLEKAKQQPGSADIPYQKKRLWDKRKSLESQAKPWLAWIDKAGEQLRTDLAGVLDAKQRQSVPPAKASDGLEGVDRIIMYTNVAIGLALIAGLLTRPAALGGAVFLLSIVLAQPAWPTIYPPEPPVAGRSLLVNKEVIEMVALLVIAAVPTGLWGGLDYFVHQFFARRRQARHAS